MKINFKHFAYYSAFFIKLFITLFTKISIVASLSGYLNYFVLLILLIVFIIQSKVYNFKRLILIIFFFTILGISAYYCKDLTLLQLLLFIICFKDIRINDFLKFSLISKIIIIFITIFLWKIGILDETITYRMGDNIARHSWGFNHPNSFGLILFSVCCDLFYLHYKKIKIFDLIILFISLIISIFVCNSRSAQVGIITLLICSFLLPKFGDKLFFKKTIMYLPILLFILSIILMLIYPLKLSWVLAIDKNFSSRIFLANSFFKYYGINLFGHFFEFYGDPNAAPWFYALDSGYIHLLIKFGVLPSILFIYLLVNTIKNATKLNKLQVLVYLIPFIIYGLMEVHILYFQFNTILLYCGSLFYFNDDVNS